MPIEITTPCTVCATEAAFRNSAMFASRGLDWPLTTVAGYQVHKCCTTEIERRVADVRDGGLVIGEDGVGRWASNGQAIPDDCAAMFAALGLTPLLDAAATAAARQAETEKALAAYRANPPQATGEHLAEMRAAFGPGATVVDVITGQAVAL